MSSFTFNDISSDDLGLIITETPNRPTWTETLEKIAIPGKATSSYKKTKMYANQPLTIKAVISDTSQINDIYVSLCGTGKLILSSNTSEYINATVSELLPRSVALTMSELPITFTCSPFCYSVSSALVNISEATTYTAVNNNGTIYSEPVIKFKMNSGISVLMGDVNFDGVVDATDAQLVLEEYTSVQSGAGSILTDAQKAVADVNGDGVVDILDANEILEIYANSQGSSGTQTMSDVYISVNGETLKISVPEAVVNSGYEVTIDSSLQLIYYTNYDGDKINIMQYSYGDLPLLHIGTNYIKYIGDINSMTITVNERWL